MRLKLTLLASSIILTSINVHALTQSDIDYAAKNIKLTTGLVENKPQDCPPGSPWGHCYRVEIELENTGKRELNKDIEIYFSSYHRSLGSKSDEFKIEHINGDLHKLTTTDRFKGLKSGQTKKFNIDFMNWIVSDSDFFPNYYVAGANLQARNILNTQPLLDKVGLDELSGFSRGIKNTENQLKRNAGDLLPAATASSRYADNVKTRDLGIEAVSANILPTPMKTTLLGGKLDITQGFNIVSDALPLNQLQALNERFRTLGIKTSQGVTIDVKVKPDQSKSSGSYTLTIDEDKIAVIGTDNAGAFYGVQSVAGMITLGKNTLDTVLIQDQPRYDYRGMHLDVSRNFHSKAFVFKLMDQMAAYKLNKFHFHLADDEGWRLEINGLPELTEVGAHRCHDLDENKCMLPQLGSGAELPNTGSGYYTREDYKDILEYASARNIQVIPSMDMPGHSLAAVKAMEARYRKLMAEGDQTAAEMYLLSDPYDTTKYYSIQHYKDNTINPCLESSFIFMDKVIDEINKLHTEAGQPLTDYHIGADETSGAWGDSPACRKMFVDPKSGIKNAKDLGGYFINRISHILDTKGLTLGAWNDGLSHAVIEPSKLAGAPAKAWVWGTMFWGGVDNYNNFANKGYDVVVVPPDAYYFDMPYENDPKERGYYWATRYTNTKKAFSFMPDNIPANVEWMSDRMGAPISAVTGEKKRDFIGVQGAFWSEVTRTDAQAEYMIFPRIFAIAERGWHKADWELKHKPGMEFKTNVDGNKGTTHLNENAELRDADWEKFSNLIGYKELPKLDKANIHYRLPIVGAVIDKGYLNANTPFSGVQVQYSIDGKNWKNYNIDKRPLVGNEAFVRTVATDGRKGRIINVTTKK
ncbi:beta-N-acetylhexosaminidase [Photobacterium leiognathi subsp. mandapamensis]|uniref:beta-N-acetylhexosaminidase n=1 Tax=Photobacterium leiognathi subsp. mandapamensis TaxID=48408 RepID=A0A2T3KPF6_PHOLD|nr:family 20 glycosylhydrolase [Photobacterium leiognathi]PSV05942.1 beta-N-acetylhexosaminidase [Photobacterium leiognathi subsp. mandapamensis]